eukprot:GFYU01001564.1.p1 GENE.GFYU01001564.1~~GFYU01001564.1.p1  ORF type:complete len:194 (-),score=30.06 GFYU01001564.1:172-753(-)
MTIGIDTRLSHAVGVPGGSNKVTLMMFDMSGDPRFRTIMSSYCKGPDIVVYVFNKTSRASMEELRDDIIPTCERALNRTAIKVVLANFSHESEVEGTTDSDTDSHSAGNSSHSSHSSDAPVSTAEGEAVAKSVGATYYEVSAKYDAHIEEAIEDAVHIALVQMSTQDTQRKSLADIRDTNNSTSPGATQCSVM